MSVLDDVKTMLGEMIDESFDDQIVLLIDVAITPLTQVGALKALSGPIDADTEWEDIVVNPPHETLNNALSAIKQYVYLNVKLLFDPPVSGVTNIFEEKIKEMLWRIEVIYSEGN